MRKRSLQQTPQLCLFGDADYASGEDLSTQAYTAVAVAAAEVVQTSFAQINPLPEPINVMLSDVAGGDDAALTKSTEMIATPDLLSEEANACEIRQQQAWPAFDAAQYAPANGKSQRISDNLAAIKLAKEILAIPTRIPTSEERHTMLKYSGWGGFAKVFEEYEGNKSAAEQQQLRGVMTEQEFASARASVTTAYYTPASLVSYVWGIVRKVGFTGGRILEPAAGNGLFLAGMPQDIAQNSSTMAVELDSVGAQLLQAAFRGTAVKALHSPIEKAPIKDKSFDLVIGNVPFGNFKSLEIRSVPYSEWLIHNYFFGKAVDAVRPGGLIVMLTSTGTLDSASNTHRQWIDAHAELLSAVRLPQGMFKAHSGTEVSVDLLVLRRREVVKFTEQGTGWKKTEKPSDAILNSQWRIKSGGNRFSSVSYDMTPEINQWFNSKPGLLIGELQTQKNQYGQDALVLVEQGDTEFRLSDALNGIPESVYKPPVMTSTTAQHVQTMNLRRLSALSQAKPGSFMLRGAQICVAEDAQTWLVVDDAFKATSRSKLLSYMRVRDAARALIELQAESNDDAALATYQRKLSVVYEAFVSAHGHLGERGNLRIYRSDPDCPLVLSLESYDEDTETYKKAAIFSKRTVGRREPPSSVETLDEAINVCLASHGRLVVPTMAKLLGQTAANVVDALKVSDRTYLDPETSQWMCADEYLSGHIRNKLTVAQASGSEFERNVEALTKALPKPLLPSEVNIRLGAIWIDPSVIAEFATELVGGDPKPTHGSPLEVRYSVEGASWAVEAGYKNAHYGTTSLNHQKWGTADRCGLDLLEAALNQSPPKIERTIQGGGTYVDKVATLAAREKYEAIKEEFVRWCRSDAQRLQALIDRYNELFNQIVERKYDGSHLMLPGMSYAVTPYQHQFDAIWRILCSGNTLLAHVVGAGKTFTMVSAAMELKRLGKAAKPCIAVPNHMLEQFTREALQFYPTARLIMASKDDLLGDRRKQFAARIATGDWDMVVMTHGTFERLPVKPDAYEGFISECKAQIRVALCGTKSSDRRSVKQIETMLKALEAKLERSRGDSKKDDLVYFDELGIDYLMVDEAHLFKNLLRVSKMQRVAGLSATSSQRAFDLWVKTNLLMKAHNDEERGVVFATATPIANSLAEMHTMKKFLMPVTLRSMGLYQFDAWAATFGEAVTGMEIAPDGSGYRLNTRFSKFVNVPELMSIYKKVADIRTRRMLNLPTPKVDGGKPKVVVAPSCERLKAITATLVERAEAIRNGSVKPHEDNMLAVTNDGRKSALDVRLYEQCDFNPSSKVGLCIDEIVKYHHESAAIRGTQMVFCDLSTPKSVGFSVYNDMRMRLIERGIAADEIAFIHDADTDTKKASLFRKVRSGTVRVLFGSTSRLGVGTNVQDRLRVVHQLDAPWRPCDVEQRDGRGLRVGNMNESVALVRYVTEGSLDSWLWQILETKSGFIDQIMESAAGVRSVEDLSMGALSYAEIKAIASGNPMVLEKASVDAEVSKLRVLRNLHLDNQWRAQNDLARAIERLGRLHDAMPAVRKAAREILETPPEQWSFKSTYKLSARASEASTLAERIGIQFSHVSAGSDAPYTSLGCVQGMNLDVVRGWRGIELRVQSPVGESYFVDRTGVKMSETQATGQLVLDLIAGLGDLEAEATRKIAGCEKDIEYATAMLSGEFEQEEKLQSLIARQAQIEAQLDLGKDQEGAAAVDANATIASREKLEVDDAEELEAA